MPRLKSLINSIDTKDCHLIIKTKTFEFKLTLELAYYEVN